MSPPKVLTFPILILFQLHEKAEIFLVLIKQKYRCELLDDRVHH